VKPLSTDASAGIAQALGGDRRALLAERVAFVHERFGQPAIAEEFIDGRELYVSIVGNGDNLEILPITEMIFDRRRTRPEERIATQSAKWDESYRDRKGIKNVFAGRSRRRHANELKRSAGRPIARSGSGTMPGWTCGSPRAARSGSSRPTRTRS
jgi:predicted ATP-grasp superfamily ATP-dependent carboligase